MDFVSLAHKSPEEGWPVLASDGGDLGFPQLVVLLAWPSWSKVVLKLSPPHLQSRR